MFTKGGNKVFDTATHYQPVWIGAHEADRIADIIPPKAGVAVYYQCVILANLYILKRKTGRVLIKYLGSRDELVEDAGNVSRKSTCPPRLSSNLSL